MAMRITLYFNQSNHGWTETWYNGDVTPPTSLTTGLKNLFKLAVAFRAPLTTLQWVRFSILGAPGKTRSFRLSGIVASEESAAATPDIVSTDALFRLYAANFGRRNIYIRGIPDAGVQRKADGTFVIGAELLDGIEKYLDRIIALNWGMQQTITPAFGGPAYTYVLAIQQDATYSQLTDLTIKSGSLAVAVGDQIALKGTWDKKQVPGLPTKAKVVRFAAGATDSIGIQYTMPSNANFQPSLMRVGLANTQIVALTDYDFQSFSERKTGRPFGSLRGRSRAAFARR